MSDQNPFTNINPKLFPSKHTGRPLKESRKEQKKEAARAVSEEALTEDTALFLKAIGNIQKPKPIKREKNDEPNMADVLATSLAGVKPINKANKTVTAHAAAKSIIKTEPLAQEQGMESAGFTADPKLARLNQEKKRVHLGNGSLSALEASNKKSELSALTALAEAAEDNTQASVYPEDDMAFFSAIQSLGAVTPLAGKGREIPPVIIPGKTKPPTPSDPLKDFMDGKVEFSLSGTEEFMEGHVVGLDLLTVGKLQARQYSPEAHIDLHGLNAEQAYGTLVGFFKNAYHKSLRTVLVVTGRGLNSPNNTPVLRNKLAEWLTKEPFKRVILAFCTAAPEDGGPGAIYVLLRKYRKNSGKILWDKMPSDAEFFL